MLSISWSLVVEQVVVLTIEVVEAVPVVSGPEHHFRSFRVLLTP